MVTSYISRRHAEIGDAISRIRTKRRWSRTKLATKVLPLLEGSDFEDTVTEAWLKRLESGKVAKIPWEILNALCSALACSLREHSRIMLLANMNVLDEGAETITPALELLNFGVRSMKEEASNILVDLLQDTQADTLDDEELLELTYTAMEMVLQRRKRRL